MLNSRLVARLEVKALKQSRRSDMVECSGRGDIRILRASLRSSE